MTNHGKGTTTSTCRLLAMAFIHVFVIRLIAGFSRVYDHPNIIVHFDGSLRKPRDPGFPTDSLGWMASCSACIADASSGEILSLGGRKIIVKEEYSSKPITSQQVEYEGLQLAFAGIASLVQRRKNANDNIPSFRNILIRGDCKTTIQQMQGRARARKLGDVQDRALAFVLNPANGLQQSNITFEHIPRADNHICDRTCAVILQFQQQEALELSFQQILGRVRELNAAEHNNNDATHGEKQKVKRQLELSNPFFTPDIQETWTLIPFSHRPQLYEAICKTLVSTSPGAGHHERYGAILLEVSNRLRCEVDTIWSQSNVSQYPTDHLTKLRAIALAWEFLAMKPSGRQKDLDRLERKHRYLLKTNRRLVEDMMGNFSYCSKSTRRVEPIPPPDPVFSWSQAALNSSAWSNDKVFWHNFSTGWTVDS